MVSNTTPGQRLSRRERVALGCLFALFALFGLAVEKRSAFMRRRMCDVGCYLRAALVGPAHPARAGVPAARRPHADARPGQPAAAAPGLRGGGGAAARAAAASGAVAGGGRLPQDLPRLPAPGAAVPARRPLPG